MRVALFIPCYVDQLKPEVGLASLRLLEALDIEVVYPANQTCCGQPFLTAGETDAARDLGRRFAHCFSEAATQGPVDAIVTPSGSCAATLRQQGPEWSPDENGRRVAEATREICEFLVDDGRLLERSGRFDHRVGLHASCHALRELKQGTPSETREPARVDPARRLLESLHGIELIDLTRRDECCGFGGLFSVNEEDVSCRMGLDRLADHRRGGAEVIVSTDVSCLLHLGGLAARREMPVRTMHIAEILAESLLGKEDAHGAR